MILSLYRTGARHRIVAIESVTILVLIQSTTLYTISYNLLLLWLNQRILATEILATGMLADVILAIGMLADVILATGMLADVILATEILATGILATVILATGILAAVILATGILQIFVLEHSILNHKKWFFLIKCSILQ